MDLKNKSSNVFVLKQSCMPFSHTFHSPKILLIFLIDLSVTLKKYGKYLLETGEYYNCSWQDAFILR